MESLHISTEGFQGLQQIVDPPKTESPSQPLRRGTTGMVQRLESCHLGDIEGNPSPGVVRSGSLPSATPNMTANSTPRLTAFNPPSTGKPPLKFFPFAPFMSMPWRSDPNLQLQDIPLAQNDWTCMQPQDEASNKRKREGELEQAMPHPTQRSKDEQLSTEPSFSPQMNGIELARFDLFGHPSTAPMTTSSNNMSSPTSTMQSFCWKPNPNNANSKMRPSPLTTIKSSTSAIVSQNIRGSQQLSPQNSSSVQTDSNGRPQKDTVTVPARLVPEQSVSPRTRTVEIPRSPIPAQDQARQMMLFRRAVNSPFHQGVQAPNSGALPAMNRNNQFQIPRLVPPQAFPFQGFQRSHQNPIPNRPQNPQTYPSDVLRKPSLYKVPPWSSPPSPTSPTQSSVSRSPISNASVGSSNTGMTSRTSGGKGFSDPQRMNMTLAPGMGGQGQFLTQRMMPVTPPRTPPLQSQRSSQPRSPPPPQPQLNPNKRKYSPNL